MARGYPYYSLLSWPIHLKKLEPYIERGMRPQHSPSGCLECDSLNLVQECHTREDIHVARANHDGGCPLSGYRGLGL